VTTDVGISAHGSDTLPAGTPDWIRQPLPGLPQKRRPTRYEPGGVRPPAIQGGPLRGQSLRSTSVSDLNHGAASQNARTRETQAAGPWPVWSLIRRCAPFVRSTNRRGGADGYKPASSFNSQTGAGLILATLPLQSRTLAEKTRFKPLLPTSPSLI